MSNPSTRFRRCEYCNTFSGGALLCTACESLQVWTITTCAPTRHVLVEERESETEYVITGGGVLPAHANTPRIPIRRGSTGVGGKRGGRRTALDCLSFVRTQFPDARRIVAWPKTVAEVS